MMMETNKLIEKITADTIYDMIGEITVRQKSTGKIINVPKFDRRRHEKIDGEASTASDEPLRSKSDYQIALKEVERNGITLYFSSLNIDKFPPEISSHTQLQEIDIFQTPISDLSPLSKLTKLVILEIAYTKVKTLEPIKSLKNLEFISLSGTKTFTDFNSLKYFKNLTDLSLQNTQIKDLSVLSTLNNLERLYIEDTQISDISPILNLKNLKHLDVSNTPYAKSMQGKPLPKIGKNCEIII